MAATPKKLVHWALDLAKSPDIGSPASEGSSSDTCSSSLPYINSQLIAHGFTYKPGISLDGTSKADAERVVKCLLSMLNQRMDDMSRTEDLSSKIRSLSYDHERLMSMYRSAIETTANAEKEMNMHKARLATANRTLQSTENAHKQTTQELQRTRTALQAIRSTHQTEIKKLEQEKDKILARWTKLIDSQPGGLNKSGPSAKYHCANSEVVEASDVQLRGRGSDLMEAALDQAERARHDLLDENERLKGIIMSTANELQRTYYAAQCLTSAERPEEPPVLTSMDLFPFAPANAAWDMISFFMNGIKELFEPLNDPERFMGSPAYTAKDEERKESEDRAKAREVGRLQAVIANLTSELNDAQTQAKDYATQAKEMFERFAEEQRVTNTTIHAKIVAAQDEENEKLSQREQELEEERQRITDAFMKMSREKAAFEAERIQFLEEKRAWHVQAMLVDLPPAATPVENEAGPSTSFSAHVSPAPSPKHSPIPPNRKLPRKSRSSTSAAVSGAKKVRAPRRSSGLHKAKGKERTSSSRVIPSFETEVIAPRSSQPQPSFKTKMPSSLPQPPQVVAPAFVLPPPSPAAQLPSRDSIFTSNPLFPVDKPALHSHTSHDPLSSLIPAPAATRPEEPTVPSSSTYNNPSLPPTTPGARRQFPIAKPFAPHMVHAYSPVKPSPLSRILQLGNSPDSPEAPIAAPALGSVTEEDESQELSPTPAFRRGGAAVPPLSLAELGVREDDDNPLRDKANSAMEPPARPSSALGHYPTTRDKGKARAPPPNPRPRQQAPPAEKPKAKAKTPPAKTPKVIGGGVTKKTTRMTTRSAAAAASGPSKPAPKPPLKGGPRRVPIGSSQAGPGPAWRG